MISNLRISRRHFSHHLLFTLLCLISLAQALRAQEEFTDSTEGSGTAGTICGAGHKYVYGQCVTDLCQLECDSLETKKVCASNAKTYRNKCQFEKENCLNGENNFIIYEDSCVTLPPPPEEICKAKKNSFINLPNDEYDRLCDLDTLYDKADRDALVIKDDLIPCYDPRCTKDGKFSRLQCSYNLPEWCWCADKEGRPLTDKPQKGLKAEDCDAIFDSHQSCTAPDNSTVQNGGLFSPESHCGICECIDGEITCFDHYTPDNFGELTDDQVSQLKDELVQLFYQQYKHEEHIEIDIRHVHSNPINIHPQVKKDTLAWKFNFYDRTKNNKLTPGEMFLFFRDLDKFLHCNSFIDQIIDLISADEIVTVDEWEKFFGVDLQTSTTTATTTAAGLAGSASSSTEQLSKRSAPSSGTVDLHQLKLNRFQKRKRFYYILE